ncbi:hypothetical protein C6W91_20735 [Phaeobacter sp. SYSU ZJ3003]
MQALEVPQGRGSDDAEVWTVADFDKHAYEMGTSELYRTSIMLAAAALTTNRSMYPKVLNRKP